MPLIQSGKKGSMGKNISTEMHAGKPQKQAIAIAYNVMRKNRGKKKMAHGGKMEPHEAESLHKARSNKQSDWQHTNEFYEGGMAPDEENMGRGHDTEYSHTEADHNEDLDPGSSVISEAPQGYVDPDHPRRPKDHYEPDHEDMGRNMAHGGHLGQDMDDHLEGHQDEVHKMARGGMGMMHPKHIAVIIHSKKMARGGMAKHGMSPHEFAKHAEESHGESVEHGYGGRYPVPEDEDDGMNPGSSEATDVTGGYFDGGYTGADGGEVSDDGILSNIAKKAKAMKDMMTSAGSNYQMHVDDKNKANAITSAFEGKPKPTPTPGYWSGGYSDGGEVDQMGDDEDTNDDSEVESLPFENNDDEPWSRPMKGYNSMREDTEGQHDRKNRHGVIKNIMRGLHKKHFGT